jgi:hypothetical protein
MSAKKGQEVCACLCVCVLACARVYFDAVLQMTPNKLVG